MFYTYADQSGKDDKVICINLDKVNEIIVKFKEKPSAAGKEFFGEEDCYYSVQFVFANEYRKDYEAVAMNYDELADLYEHYLGGDKLPTETAMGEFLYT